MKGFILASLFSLVYAGTVLVLFRISLPERRAVLMMRVYFFSLPPFVACLIATPADFWILPPSLTEPVAWLDIAFGLFTYSASVFGGWLQLYNLADRGLSLRILIDAMENGSELVSPQYLVTAYGQGKGVVWMYRKRLSDLMRLGLVRSDGDAVVITEKGQRNARLIRWVRRQYILIRFWIMM